MPARALQWRVYDIVVQVPWRPCRSGLVREEAGTDTPHPACIGNC